MIREKKQDGLSLMLLAMIAVFAVLALLGLPAGLVRITLLNYCTRPSMILSLCGLLLLLRSLALWFEHRSSRGLRMTAVTLCLLSVIAGAFVNPVQRGLASVQDLPRYRRWLPRTCRRTR